MLSPELSTLLGAVAVAILTAILSELRVRNARTSAELTCRAACALAAARLNAAQYASVDLVEPPQGKEKAAKGS